MLWPSSTTLHPPSRSSDLSLGSPSSHLTLVSCVVWRPRAYQGTLSLTRLYVFLYIRLWVVLIRQPFQPYLTYFALFFTCALTFFKGFDSFMPFAYKTFITHYIGIPVYVFGYLGYKCMLPPPNSLQYSHWRLVIRKTKAVKMHEMDLSTGSREFADLDGEGEDDGYADMNWKQKAVYNLKNWWLWSEVDFILLRARKGKRETIVHTYIQIVNRYVFARLGVCRYLGWSWENLRIASFLIIITGL